MQEKDVSIWARPRTGEVKSEFEKESTEVAKFG
jgi:hypothetical protein